MWAHVETGALKIFSAPAPKAVGHSLPGQHVPALNVLVAPQALGSLSGGTPLGVCSSCIVTARRVLAVLAVTRLIT
jgi:hypothetical protein